MNARKVLLIRPGGIGDFILSLPALEFLRGDYTEVWCNEQNVSLARFADRAQSILSAGLDRVGVLNADDVLERLSAFDRIHSWYGCARPDFREAVKHLPFEFFPALPREGGTQATAFYCAQVCAPVTRPHIAVPDVRREEWVAIHPFASSPAKRWPLANFQALASRVGQVRWLAGPEEDLENAVRIPDLFDLACWLKRARMYIGNDSGITHLAAAIGVPTIAIFGPSDPSIWAPIGDQVRIVRKLPLDELPVETVLDLVRLLL